MPIATILLGKDRSKRCWNEGLLLYFAQHTGRNNLLLAIFEYDKHVAVSAPNALSITAYSLANLSRIGTAHQLCNAVAQVYVLHLFSRN